MSSHSINEDAQRLTPEPSASLAHGVDIIEIERVSRAVNLWGERFLNRIYTRKEITYCKGRAPELAARFAAKEAVMKALGTGHVGVTAREIEILTDTTGVPSIYLHGRTQEKAEAINLHSLTISLSHSRDYAIASVIGNRS